MNKNEMKATLGIIKTAYPGFGGDCDPKEILELWAEMFASDPAPLVADAVKRYIQTGKFPPTIADIRAIITDMTASTVTSGDIWQEVYRLLNADISPDDPDTAYAKMSDICREAVLAVGGWYSLSMSPEDDQYVRRVFLKAAQARLDRDRQLGIPFDRTKVPELLPCDPLPIGGELHG